MRVQLLPKRNASGARLTKRALAATIALATTGVADACPMHVSLGLDDPPTAIWPSSFSRSSTGGTTSTLGAASLTASGSLSSGPTITTFASIIDPAITSWRINTTGASGHSTDATINALVIAENADVQTVAYNSSGVYIKASGVPTHDVGPFPGNPAYPSDRNRTFHIPRTPQVNNGTKTSVGLGSIGVMVNGVPIFDARDAASYNNQNVWHQNANYWEASSFDTAPGHPAPDMTSTTTPKTGTYHYHHAPLSLISQLDFGNTGQHHSPLIGFAFDGYPIYGPYGYANADGSGGVKKISSSYGLRNITTRTTLPGGSTASSAGPNVSAQYPLGAYTEDYAYTAGSGDLDQYNGRFVVTPEYPQGTYAYFVTLNAAGTAVYPYIIGPQYYGIVSADNLPGGTITVPGDVVSYTPAPEPGTAGLLLVAGGLLALRRQRRQAAVC